jgi:RNA polymerase sigma factor (sigma-70 family)
VTIDITEHLPLVHWVIDRYYTRRISGRIEREDLVSEGYMGLVKAAEKFDPARGFQFSTYAVHRVRNYIGRYMQNHGRLVRVPIYLQDGERGKRLRPETIRWLDAPHGVDPSRTLHDFMGSDDPAQSNALAAEDIKRLVASIRDKRARFAVHHWYLKDRTLEEIGANIGGVSRERVRQLVLQGVAEMRRHVGVARPRTPPAVPTLTQEQRWRMALLVYKERQAAADAEAAPYS